MDCSLIQDRLIAYHFATLGDDERLEVEAHLVGCTGCLRRYLALKAHVDHGSRAEDRPSEAARLRLRAAVEARFRPTPARRMRRWLTRPVPLYQGFALAAFLAAAAAALVPSLTRAVHPRLEARSAERIDSARPTSKSLTIY